jgi:hypothetical protein
MKVLAEAIEDYLALRRGLGFKLKRHSRCLKEFASFLEHAGEPRITTRLALQWATQPRVCAKFVGERRAVGQPTERCSQNSSQRPLS